MTGAHTLATYTAGQDVEVFFPLRRRRGQRQAQTLARGTWCPGVVAKSHPVGYWVAVRGPADSQAGLRAVTPERLRPAEGY